MRPRSLLATRDQALEELERAARTKSRIRLKRAAAVARQEGCSIAQIALAAGLRVDAAERLLEEGRYATT